MFLPWGVSNDASQERLFVSSFFTDHFWSSLCGVHAVRRPLFPAFFPPHVNQQGWYSERKLSDNRRGCESSTTKQMCPINCSHSEVSWWGFRLKSLWHNCSQNLNQLVESEHLEKSTHQLLRKLYWPFFKSTGGCLFLMNWDRKRFSLKCI